ncbi:MAG TPA: YfhO family protein [Vicinamibacterales bacterium]|nr:YfhO family protein [Vicinamibacterales bacterium]
MRDRTDLMDAPRSRGWIWPLVSLVAAIIPVAGVFTLSRIFFVRDLTLAFRSRFLFFRHAVFSGVYPLWDPYVANGQSAMSDALYQLFHFPSIPIRLLLPDIVAYNVWIALPVPLAAAGAYLYLRRYVGRPAAALGAIAFAVAGPTVSTTNFPNLSWSVACVPYVFAAIDRVADKRRAPAVAVLAVVLSAQALAGEPVTLGATLAIAALYVLWPLAGWRDWRLLVLTGSGALLGMLLAAIQYVPLAQAGSQSVRSFMEPDDFWSLHPLALFELFAPHFFGEYFHSNLSELTWMPALNSGREPFYYSMYLGVPVMMTAAVAACARRPRTTFWMLVVAGCVIASMGAHTPVYPLLQAIVPGLRAFRFPVKYLSLAAMGISVLAALTVEWMQRGEVPRRALQIVVVLSVLAGALIYGFVAWQMIAPRLPLYLVFETAQRVHVRSPIQGAEFLIYRARPLLSAVVLKILCGAFLIAVASARRRERRLALGVLYAFMAVDLVLANSTVNPTMSAALLDKPGWLRQIPADLHTRIYVGGRLGGYVEATDVDSPKYIREIPGHTPMEQRFIAVNELAFHPSGWKIRETMSYDLPLIWPVLNMKTQNRFRTAPRVDRMRFLLRAGMRYAILPAPAPDDLQPLAALVGAEQLKLYDVNPNARRAYIVTDALLGPDPDWAVEGLFQPRFDPSSGVLVSEPPPPPAGLPGAPVPASAEFVEDGLNRVVVRAGLPADGYLALLDSYDPYWHVDVDGAAAPLMRANGLFRAVHLRPGTHVVTFTYRPLTLYAGAALSGAAALTLAAWCLVEKRKRPVSQSA